MALLTIQEASQWATRRLAREVTPTNISYLVQYGKVRKYGANGSTRVNMRDLEYYYESWHGKREARWKQKLGNDLNWALSFDHLREKDTTKHVHRLHPYKGKFIPQLVQYFLDNHTDDFKRRAYFKKGDIVLDPFAGSGTTLVQANELGLHSVGVDISHFNCMISDVKMQGYNLTTLKQEIERLRVAIMNFQRDNAADSFEHELTDTLYAFNRTHFPTPAFKYRVGRGEINEIQYAAEKEKEFLKIYLGLIKKYNITLAQSHANTFLDTWYTQNVRNEINFAFARVKEISDVRNKKALAVILSRTTRSCRATTHSDLATLKDPQLATYYCWKHKKICKPLYSIREWFDRYAADTIARLEEFYALKTSAQYAMVPADSRTVNLLSETKRRNKALYALLETQKIRGIFTSPPYVGQIDYHEQHAYAYDLFGFTRKDELEIGPLYRGQGREARASYIEGIAQVLLNNKKYLQDGYDVFLVANDKYNLYPTIAERAGMKIVNQFKRPVINRTERDQNPYSETVFHLIAA